MALKIFSRSSILDIWLSSEYVFSGNYTKAIFSERKLFETFWENNTSMNSVFVGNKAKVEFRNGRFKKTKHAKFSEIWTFLTPWYARVRFSKNLAWFVFFLKRLFWDSSLFFLITEVFLILNFDRPNMLQILNPKNHNSVFASPLKNWNLF